MPSLIVRPRVSDFLNKLENSAYAKSLRLLTLLNKYRYELREPYTKKITGNIYELRIKGKQEVRLFYGYRNNDIIIVSGFVKKTQKIPSTEIDKAEREFAGLDI